MIGTVRNSTATDGTRTGPGTYQNSGNISEIIQFTPELFMATPAEKTTSLGNTYDAVTALPPLFYCVIHRDLSWQYILLTLE